MRFFQLSMQGLDLGLDLKVKKRLWFGNRAFLKFEYFAKRLTIMMA
jgi:hypothetical protein